MTPAPALSGITTQTVIQSFNYTAGLSASIGVTITDRYGNALAPRVTTTETTVSSSPSIYTANIPGFDGSRSGYFVWDNAGAVIAKVPYTGPQRSSLQYAPGYKPTFPAIGR